MKYKFYNYLIFSEHETFLALFNALARKLLGTKEKKYQKTVLRKKHLSFS